MTAPKFTPGEFRVVPTGLVRADVVAESGRPVCVNVLMADAHLFAAAPELYVFVERVCERMRHGLPMHGEGMWGDAEAALAKARGEG